MVQHRNVYDLKGDTAAVGEKSEWERKKHIPFPFSVRHGGETHLCKSQKICNMILRVDCRLESSKIDRIPSLCFY